MENNESSKTTPFVLSTPIAIVIAGAFIAGAIYASGGGFTQKATPTTSVKPATQTTAPAAGEPAAPAEITFAEITDEDQITGATNPKVTLLEYSDLECPFCRQFHPTVKKLLEEFPDDLRVVYRHFPLESIHPRARNAAIASECAGDQGKFWEYIDYVFTNTTTGTDLEEAKLIEYGPLAGVPNQTAFTTCIQEKPYDDLVTEQVADAQGAGARGTPYSILIGPDGTKTPISGAQPYEAVKAQVTKILEG